MASIAFEPVSRYPADRKDCVTVCGPRMFPASPPLPPDHIEYEYTLYHGSEQYGLGLVGTDRLIEADGRPTYQSTLDFDRDWVLDRIFRLKQEWGDDTADFAFLCRLADGMLGVVTEPGNAREGMRCLALTRASMLEERGIAIPQQAVRLETGEIVLAERCVAVRAHDVSPVRGRMASRVTPTT